MATLLETFTCDMLTPAQNPQDARLDAIQFGASLTILKGAAVAIKASDGKGYNLNSTAGTNEVQTVTFAIASTGGSVALELWDPRINNYVKVEAAAWNATDATYLAAIQAKLDLAFAAANIVVVTAQAATDTDSALVFTWSGTGVAGKACVDGSNQAKLPIVTTLPTSSTSYAVARTTSGGTTDGTQKCVGFSQYNYQTDSAGKVYRLSSGTAAATYRTPPETIGSIYTSGTFDPQDLTTLGTPVAEVDTFTPTNPTTADVYTITITYPDGSTKAVSATIGATQTATAATTLLKAAWNADTADSQGRKATDYAAASGTTTFILTSAVAGNVMSVAGAVTGTGTITKVITTAATGRAIADILPGIPGARTLHNGFWKI